MGEDAQKKEAIESIMFALVKATPWYVTDGIARGKLKPLEEILVAAYDKNPQLIDELALKVKIIHKNERHVELLDSLKEVGKYFKGKGVTAENASNMLIQVLLDMKKEQSFTPDEITRLDRRLNNYVYDEARQTLTPSTKMAAHKQPV